MGPAAGTPEFLQRLLGRKFLDPAPFVEYKNGEEVNGFNLENDGFKKPIVVSKIAGLRMKVPPSNFTLQDVVKFTDPGIPIDVIDVELQSDARLPLGDFVDRFYAKPRERILNVLSFEYSGTKLAMQIRPPHVVKELSLVDNCWSESVDDDDEFGSASAEKPHVQKYCLMSMAGSYTDFHIDFGGSSVWYHILWGEKIFYVTPPRKSYLDAYWRWNGHFDNRHIFFPDTLESRIPVARLHLKAGETVLLPSCWIHAVYTPSDSLVFGGNFLTQLSIPLQLQTYHMEVLQETESRFLFPFFEKLHWFAADVILGKLTNYLYAGQEPPVYLLKAAQALVAPLRQWYEMRKGLPKGERNSHLPVRAYLQYAYPTLINKLEDLAHSFILRSSPHRGRKHRSLSGGLVERSPSPGEQSDSTDPQVLDSDTERYHSSSHCRHGSSEDDNGEENEEEEEEDEESVMREVLDAVPELLNSKLVDDQYIFPISESAEAGGRTRPSRRRNSKAATKSEDPDPTWCASSSNALAKRRRISFASSKGPTPPQTYPRPHNVSHPNRSHHSSHSHNREADAPSTSSRKPPPVRKTKTTVRERLAKRLGL